ncbi:MAG TPA: A24 family peptidase, partial [Deinococcales bacterium]|nr:A24 family peptidase [Deinococcales bacterium]
LSLAALAAGYGPGLIVGVQGALLAAGGTALLAGLYWAFRPDPAEDEEGDPVAMGFGDVKLAAAIGAFLGWEGLVVALAISVVLGAVVGLLARAAGGGRELPFGPFMAAGALVALFLGSAPLEAYLGTIGL